MGMKIQSVWHLGRDRRGKKKTGLKKISSFKHFKLPSQEIIKVSAFKLEPQ